MIAIHNIRDVKQGQFDEVWAIVRYYKGKSDWIKQIIDLAPSHYLWSKYQSLKLGKNWNIESFNSIYLPIFLKEMKTESAKKRLNELYKADKDGKCIALVCFCTDEALCHRSIIAGLLQGVGCNVYTPTNSDYSEYYNQYKQG